MATTKKKAGANKAAASKPAKQTKQASAAKATGRRATQRLGAAARPTRRKSKTRVLKTEQAAEPVASGEPVVGPAAAVKVASSLETSPAPSPAESAGASGARPRGEVLRFDPARIAPAEDEWISVVYEGPELFVHAEAGVFARGTRTRLRRAVAEQLRDTRGFRLLKAG